MKLPWLKPPPPPPAPTTFLGFDAAAACAGLFLLLLAWWVYLLCTKRDLLTPTLARRTPWLHVLIVIARVASGGSLLPMVPPSGSTAVTAFSLLFVAESLGILFASVGPPRVFGYLRAAPMSVHGCALLYYLYEPDSILTLDVFGRPLHPMRYLLWTLSVSCMVLSIFYVVDSIIGKRVPGVIPPTPATMQALHDLGRRAMLSVLSCMGFGYLGAQLKLQPQIASLLGHELDPSLISSPAPSCFDYPLGLLPNLLMFLLSLASFYYMIYALSAMLIDAQNHPLLKVSGVDKQFRLVRYTVVVVWHLFPVVWVAAAAGWMSVEAEHGSYIALDIVAKFLLLFVYTTTVNNE